MSHPGSPRRRFSILDAAARGSLLAMGLAAVLSVLVVVGQMANLSGWLARWGKLSMPTSSMMPSPSRPASPPEVVGDGPFKKADWEAFAAGFRRFQTKDAAALEDELRAVPQVGMTATREAQTAAVAARPTDLFQGPTSVLRSHPELEHLPFTKGHGCASGDDHARNLANHASQLRQISPRGNLVVEGHRSRDWFVKLYAEPAALPALVQVLQAEDAASRSTLVEMLARIRGARAAEALVQRAVFDVDATVRMEAVYALRSRPVEQYCDALIADLNHPWDAAVQHAAEAIANLDGAITPADLRKAVERRQPRKRTAVGGSTHVREMVRMNHVNNCLVCHAVSAGDTSPLRAAIPEPYTLPTPFIPYYGEGVGLLVRADITYLRQDFSVMQMLPEDEACAGRDRFDRPYRFDFLVHTRPLRDGETVQTASDTVRAEALVFAMTGRRPEELPMAR